ncbi:hypothetical protein Leryth_012562 [Lithospermum erythrorhizon]|nr:hypothetical protein Leryth_012562 [Lithospermum erythrorhizon]
MDIRNWSKARSKTVVQFGRLRHAEPEYPLNPPLKEQASTSSKGSIWKGKWKKFLKDKKKMFKSSVHHHHVHGAPYDEFSYAQNFDQGLAWDDGEPDGLTRSFSVRFADSRRFNIRKELISGVTFED